MSEFWPSYTAQKEVVCNPKCRQDGATYGCKTMVAKLFILIITKVEIKWYTSSRARVKIGMMERVQTQLPNPAPLWRIQFPCSYKMAMVVLHSLDVIIQSLVASFQYEAEDYWNWGLLRWTGLMTVAFSIPPRQISTTLLHGMVSHVQPWAQPSWLSTNLTN